jgi:hypothetical protein
LSVFPSVIGDLYKFVFAYPNSGRHGRVTETVLKYYF